MGSQAGVSVTLSTVVNTAAAATTTGSITPDAYDAVFVYSLVTSGAAFTDTASCSGAGLTWTKVLGVVTGNDYGVLFVGYGTPTSGALTITFSRTPTAGRYAIVKIPLAQEGTNPVATSNSGTGTATSGTVTLTKASATDQQLFSVFMHKAAEAATPRANWTEITDVATTYGMESQYSWGYDSASATWTSNVVWVGIAVSLAPIAQSADLETDDAMPGYGITSPDIMPASDFDVWALHD